PRKSRRIAAWSRGAAGTFRRADLACRETRGGRRARARTKSSRRRRGRRTAALRLPCARSWRGDYRPARAPPQRRGLGIVPWPADTTSEAIASAASAADRNILCESLDIPRTMPYLSLCIPISDIALSEPRTHLGG